jgi:hypothetical protein
MTARQYVTSSLSDCHFILFLTAAIIKTEQNNISSWQLF